MSDLWESHPLQSLVTKVGSGSTPRGGSEAYKAVGTPLIRSMNVVFFGFKRKGLVYIDDEQAAQLDNATVKAGDVLLNITGASIGRVTLAPAEFEGARVNQHVCVIRPNEALDARFLNAYLSSPALQDQIWNDNFGVTRQALTKQQILDFEIPLPPKPEQVRIVNELDTLLARVQACNDRFDAIPALLKRFRSSVLKAAVSGHLTSDCRSDNLSVAKKTDSLWHIPDSWRWACAEEVTGFITKGTTPSKEKMSSGSGEVPYIKVYNLGFNGRVDFTVAPTFVDSTTHSVDLKRSITLPGDVLMNIVGPPLGKVAIVPDSYPEWNINQAIARFRPDIGLLSPYLAICLMSTELIAHAVSQAKATVGQLNLTLEICRALPIPIPPAIEQSEIVRRVEAMLALADRIEARCAVVSAQAQRLTPLVLAKAFRGELVPQDPNDEPASELLASIGLARTATAKPEKKVPVGRKQTAPKPVTA